MTAAATPIYRALMLEIERRRVALGWSMDKFSEYAGLPDRYYNKAIQPDAPSGKQAQWQTIQVMMDALFASGYDLEIRARPGPVMTADNLKAKLLQLRRTNHPWSQRQLLAELGRKGGKIGGKKRWEGVGKRARSRIQRKIAIIRWEKVKAAVSQPRAVSAVRAANTCAKVNPKCAGSDSLRPQSAETGELKSPSTKRFPARHG